MAPGDDLTILVPVDISESELPDYPILDLLGSIDVVLLGYFPVPDQAVPALLKEEYEDVANDRLSEIAHGLPNLTDVLVFTHDREATIDRIAHDFDCDAVLEGGHADALDRILVPLRGDVNLDRIMSVVADFLRDTDATATLFHAVPEGGDPSEGEFLLAGTVDRLAEDGIDRDRVDWQLSTEGNPDASIVHLGSEYDLVVLGETDPSLTERIIGDFLSRVLGTLETPALIVRKPDD